MQSYKFRLKPNKEERETLYDMFNCNRFVWNYFLNLNKENYLKAKEKELKNKHLSYYDCTKRLTELKKQNDWLYNANAQGLQQTLKDLDISYNRFFKGVAKHPKFKSKKNKQSFRIPQRIEIKEDYICFNKMINGIKIIAHREVKGKIKYATISKTKTDKYFVSITTDFEETRKRKSNKEVGIDLGIKDFITLSNGEKHKLNVNEGNIKFLCKQASKKKKGSKNRKKAVLKIAKRFEKINNIKQDFQHKLSNKICSENKLIAIEDLNIKGMLKNHCLAKAIAGQSWYSFIEKLEYKAKRYKGKVAKTKRFYPSSKTCFNCGFINQDLKLSDRKWTCPKCKEELDRDINASKNILSQVLRELN